MNFSAWAIKNPVVPLLAFFMLMVLGWQSFNALPVTRFPNIDIPVVAVTVAQPGAAPAEMETQITIKIEDAVAGLTGQRTIARAVLHDGRVFRMPGGDRRRTQSPKLPDPRAGRHGRAQPGRPRATGS